MSNFEPKPTPDNDFEVANAPTDSISSMAFSPKADFLAVGSWDCHVWMYEVSANGQTRGQAIYNHPAPVLDVCWNKDGTKVFSGGIDNAGRMFDLATGQSQQVAQHDAPVKSIKWIETPRGDILATGGWDKKLKYWDLRTPAPIASVDLPERCYTMDATHPLLVVGTASRHLQIFNLNNPTVPFATMQSPLRMQTRTLACFPSADGFAVGSVEGRVGLHYMDDKDADRRYSFRCHRQDRSAVEKGNVIYAVNDMSFHPVYGTMSTCGSDGSVFIWDLDGRCRLKVFERQPGPISTTCFSRTGSIFAYAVSYDWYQGYSGMTQGHPNKIMLHGCKDEEVKKRPRLR